MQTTDSLMLSIDGVEEDTLVSSSPEVEPFWFRNCWESTRKDRGTCTVPPRSSTRYDQKNFLSIACACWRVWRWMRCVWGHTSPGSAKYTQAHTHTHTQKHIRHTCTRTHIYTTHMHTNTHINIHIHNVLENTQGLEIGTAQRRHGENLLLQLRLLGTIHHDHDPVLTGHREEESQPVFAEDTKESRWARPFHRRGE